MKKIFTGAFPYAVVAMLLVLVSFKAVAVSITSFTPRVGGPGTLVRIVGTDLSNPTNFTIGGKKATIISNTGTLLVAMVMPGAISGGISITNANGTANSKTNFFCVVMPSPNAYLNEKILANTSIGNASQGFSVGISANAQYIIEGGRTDNGGIGAAWIYHFPDSTLASTIPQPIKLVGNDLVGLAAQGTSVAISADGSTAVVGAPGDNGSNGAICVYVSQGDTAWIQQGSKLSVTAASTFFGSAVSISADGNTIVAEAPGDDSNTGAAYVFTRTGTTWVQQGNKLVGTGAVPGDTTLLGYQRVALSADGNTLIMGARNNNTTSGAAWIFTRANGVWTETPTVLTANDGHNDSNLGSAVSISADGNMAAVGGFTDSGNKGAVWIFALKNNIWKQQDTRLRSLPVIGPSQQGCSVSLNADGTVLVVGAKADSLNTGAVFTYTRADSTWSPADKIIGDGTTINNYFGNSVAVTADGIRAIAGGYNYDNGKGSTWFFTCKSGIIMGSGGQCDLSLTEIKTLPATSITFESGTINGSVKTDLTPLTVQFEYGTASDLSYALVAPVTTGNPIYKITQSNILVNYSSVLSKLKPSTKYYFRIVVAGYATGIINGQTLSFTTADTVATTPGSGIIAGGGTVGGTGTTPIVPVAAAGSGLTAATIPTAFTPNHDGINDRWEMPFLSEYPKCSVKIFNRAGQTVFASTGYTTSWDGRYNNTDLPAGAYYYVIDLNTSQKLSGAVNLIK